MDRVAAMTTFVKVVEVGSLSAAARSLEMSLPSVSRQLDGLEEHLGTRLLVRTTRHLTLTEGGRTYYEQAKRILAAIEEAEITLSAHHATPSGRLIVSAPVLLGRLHLAPILPEFLALYPKLTVDLLLLDRIVNLVEEGIDVAIQPGPLEDSTLISRKLGAFRRVVCAAPSYLQRRGEPMQPQDLENHDCVVFTLLDSAREWRFRTESGDIKVPVSGRLRTNNHDATVIAAVGGAGTRSRALLDGPRSDPRGPPDSRAATLRTARDRCLCPVPASAFDVLQGPRFHRFPRRAMRDRRTRSPPTDIGDAPSTCYPSCAS